MKVYADLVCITNFVFDLLLLLLTARIRRTPIRRLRLSLASFLGALYSVLIWFPELSPGYSVFSKLLFSSAMIFIAFGKMGMWAFIQTLLTFFGVSIFMGGGIFALEYFLNQQVSVSGGIAFTEGRPGFLFISISFVILWWLAGKAYGSLKSNRQKEIQYVKTIIEVNGKTLTCTGFIDTGNQLYEGISRTPVTITELSLWEDCLPPPLSKWASSTNILTFNPVDLPVEWTGRIRLVPYRTVSSQNNFLVAIRPDKVTFEKEGKIYCPEKMLIGLRTGTLASDGSYQAVVHSSVLEGYETIAS